MAASRFTVNESLLLLSDSKRQEEKPATAEGSGRPFSATLKAIAFHGLLACSNPPNYGGTVWVFEQVVIALQVRVWRGRGVHRLPCRVCVASPML